MSSSTPIKRHTRGFTIIELMIVLVITAVLAVIAYNVYTSYGVKAQRSTARSKLLEVAQHMERYYSANNHYPALSNQTTQNKRWTISVNLSNSKQHYTLVATKQKGLSDSQCGTMKVKSTGVKKPTSCWHTQ